MNHANSDAKNWSSLLVAYKTPSNLRSLFELAITIMPLMGLWGLMWLLAGANIGLTLLLALPAAALLVRLFMIQHDCGHQAFFTSRLANDWTGRVLGVLTLTPYDFWRHSHARHHASSGNLDQRGIGDIDTLTVNEYRLRSAWAQWRYRIYRHPLVMFGIGPAYLFLLQHRLPIGFMKGAMMPWASTMLTNLGIALTYLLLILLAGLPTFLLIQLPIVLIGASIGVWLFYVQHQFERTYWERQTDWSHADAALYGSSFYDLPAPISWVTGNIGVHHLHHLSSRIPFYRLADALSDHPELRTINRITMAESLNSVWLTLWDTDQRQLVSFAALGVPRSA